jgi:predicted nucleotidyltransferase
METLPKDFREFIELLNKNNVRYIIIGGYAVVYHGYVRSTNDIDIWIDIREDNIKNVLKALDDFGFSSLNLKEEDFSPNQIIQLGYPPNRIDLITTPAGIDFDTCYQSREQVTIDKILINIVNLENLLKLKKASNRTRDLADIEELT